ncbi:MAG: hypothetical protein QM758_07515 [Armatimonas sp.]
MNRKYALLFAALAVTGIAHADDTNSLTQRFRLQLGVGLPSSKSGRDFVGSAPIAGGLSYDLGRVASGTWGVYANSIIRTRQLRDSLPASSYVNRGAEGFGVQYRSYPTPTGVYFGGGIGAYSVSISTVNDYGSTTSTASTETSTWGGRAFIGKNLAGRVYLEAGYNWVGKASVANGPERNLSHASLNVGYRF